MIKLYENIKYYRTLNGWTQEELAKRTGYTDRSMIAKIETGKIDLSQSKIIEFAKVFGIEPGDLMGWDGWEEAEPVEDPRLFEVEWRKRGGAAHKLILTEEEEIIVLTYRAADDVDRRAVRRILRVETKKDTDVLDA